MSSGKLRGRVRRKKHCHVPHGTQHPTSACSHESSSGYWLTDRRTVSFSVSALPLYTILSRGSNRDATHGSGTASGNSSSHMMVRLSEFSLTIQLCSSFPIPFSNLASTASASPTVLTQKHLFCSANIFWQYLLRGVFIDTLKNPPRETVLIYL